MHVMNLRSVLGGCLGLLMSCAIAAQSQVPLFSNQFESGVASMAPELVYARVGTSGTGIGGPIEVTLVEPAVGDVFVPITSSDPSKLTVNGGGVTVLDGQSTANVSMTALAASPQPVLLRANLGNQVYTSVRVVDDSETRNVVSIRPNPATIAPNGSRTFIAQLNLPAPFGGSSVNLSVAPIAAGTFAPAATIAVATDSFSQSFIYTDSTAIDSATLSASIGGGPLAQATVNAAAIGKLVINEVDYDQPGSDNAEFIEIYNRSPDSVTLAGLALVLVNGADNNEYARFDLSQGADTLGPGDYLVLGNTGVSVPNGTPLLDIGSNSIVHNGAPDGIAIVDSDAIAVLDAFSYEGSMTAALIDGFPGPVNLVEGTALIAADDESGSRALARLPNGTDVNNANTDFAATTRLTPGVSNDPVVPSGHLVINEVDYDSVGTDSSEFIEIYNGTGGAVSLTNLRLVFINGSDNAQYRQVDLGVAGSLAAGQFLVARNAGVVVSPGALTIDFPGASDNVQNGAPDALALVDTALLTVVDALSYEGSVTAATITGFPGTYNLVEGTPTTATDSNTIAMSLARSPNGVDTDNAVSDWVTSAVITPGAANLPTDNETADAREFDYCVLQFPPSIIVQAGNQTPSVFGRVYDAGVTDPAGPSMSVMASFGFGPSGSNPVTSLAGWQFVVAGFNTQIGNDDEYQASVIAPGPGAFAYTYRFSRDGGVHWTYCDLNGAGSNSGNDFDAGQLGVMTVTP